MPIVVEFKYQSKQKFQMVIKDFFPHASPLPRYTESPMVRWVGVGISSRRTVGVQLVRGVLSVKVVLEIDFQSLRRWSTLQISRSLINTAHWTHK